MRVETFYISRRANGCQARMKQIPLLNDPRGTFVDDEDFEWLSQWSNWRILKADHPYVVRNEWDRETRRNKAIYMHRQILEEHGEELQGLWVDHINGNKIDNRKENLRPTTRQQNQQNRQGSNRASKSGVLGVRWFQNEKWRTGRWQARVQFEGREHHLGYFLTIEEASEAVQKFRADNMPFSKEARSKEPHATP